MRAVVQRVHRASVEVDGKMVSSIGPGLLCLIGLKAGDTQSEADFICIDNTASFEVGMVLVAGTKHIKGAHRSQAAQLQVMAEQQRGAEVLGRERALEA